MAANVVIPANRTIKRTSLITGASSGIGEAFARLLAARGDQLVITARRSDRLEMLAEALRTQYQANITVIPADLGSPDAAQDLFSETEKRGLVIDLLINNAGFGKYGSFEKSTLTDYQQMNQVNITALVDLTYLYLPGMRTRHRGGILNVASVAGMVPTPYTAVYGATKAYVLSFTQAIAEECRGEGVTISALCPGSTESEFSLVASNYKKQKTNSDNQRVQTADEVARVGLSGFEAGKVVVVPGWNNKASAAVVGHVPRSLLRRMVARVNRRDSSE